MSSFSDKELQLAAQLAYFNFTYDSKELFKPMIGISLKDIFSDKYSYNYLKEQIRYTRQFDKENHDSGSWLSRTNATIELMDNLANPSNPVGNDEDTSCVDWEKIANWKIVDIEDQNDINGFFAITIEADDKMIVAFRGSESFDPTQTLYDWVVSDFGLLVDTLTPEQESAMKYMERMSKNEIYAGREWYTTGHSLGGNLAEHALLTAPETMNVVKAVSFDGPGMSLDYLDENADKITERAYKLIHYQWSIVGGMLFPIENLVTLTCEDRKYITVRDYDDNFTFEAEPVLFTNNAQYLDAKEAFIKGGIMDYDAIMDNLERFAIRHAPCFVDFDEEGNVIPTDDYNSVRIANLTVQLISEMVDIGIHVFAPDYISTDKFDYLLSSKPSTPSSNIEKFHRYQSILQQDLGKRESYDIEDDELIIRGIAIQNALTIVQYLQNYTGTEIVNELMKRNIDSESARLRDASRIVVNRDPLALDLGGEGFDLTTVDGGVYFDLDNNGFAEKTAWVGAEDGFLVLDRNYNGNIDNGSELFGDQVWLSDGFVSVSGFDALKDLDSNGDGIIDVPVAKKALDMLEIDELGLDPADRNMLTLMYQKYGDKPVGLSTIAALTGDETSTIEDYLEPFLVQMGMIQRTPRGRIVTENAKKHLGL